MNFIIFVRDDMLFGYYEYLGTDHAADQAASRRTRDPAVVGAHRRVPASTARHTDGAQWAQMRQVWHLGQ